jgi:hypothetical protein
VFELVWEGVRWWVRRAEELLDFKGCLGWAMGAFSKLVLITVTMAYVGVCVVVLILVPMG